MAAKKTRNDYTRDTRERFAKRGMRSRGLAYTTDDTARGLKCLAALNGRTIAEYTADIIAEAVEAKLKQHGIKL